ncbi:MAG: hypothetical protein V3R54_05260 [Thermodesulfovibrionia bacterium]
MMKKTLLSIVLFTIIVSLASCGGSGSGTSGEPEGVNPGIPSIVQLLPLQIVAQTNSSIDFRAKILDGNGNPVKNEPVTFTNLSPIGVINPQLVATAGGVSIAAGGPVVVNTDSLGFAIITLYSTTSGFATVQAEVNTGLGQVRDSRTVFFTTGSLILLPSMTLEVDSNLNDIYDETDDFFILDNGNVVRIRATVYDRFDIPAPGIIVTFGTDVPYRVGQDPDAECSDGSDFCEIYFLGGNIRTTDGNGQALVDINVFPTSLRTYQTLFNVTAEADNGAFNMVTLFLDPVIATLVTVFAAPDVVSSGGTSEITASAITNLGTPLPEGTTVNFTVSPIPGGGGIEPFAQIDAAGVATVTYTAPTLDPADPDLVVTITATVAGESGTTTVIVTAPTADALEIAPSSITITDDDVNTQTLLFQITNGVPPYTVTSSNDLVAYDSAPGDGVWSVAASGDTFNVTIASSLIGAGGPDIIVILTVTDSGGSPLVQATITIQAND